MNARGRLSRDMATRAASLSFSSNFVLMIVKLAVGLLTGSIAVLSDALDSAEDVAASTFALLSIRVAARPADEDHPYGHGKAESLAAAAQALLIAGGGGFIIFQAVRRLLEADREIVVGPGLVVMAITAVVNLGAAVYVGRVARDTGSLALASDARHLWTNIVQALAVVFGLGLVGLTNRHIFDPIVALALAGYLLWTASQVFLRALEDIMDMSLPMAEVTAIERCLAAHEREVAGFHQLRTRRAGRWRHADLHLVVDPHLSVADVHDVCDRIEADIERRLPGTVVTIHVEPDDGRDWGPYHEAPEVDAGRRSH